MTQFALTSDVPGNTAVVNGLLAKSGTSPLFVSPLAKRKVIDDSLHPFWFPRAPGSSDYERLQQAREELENSNYKTGLMHRLGGGKDLVFSPS